jgi:hypothetical protein
LDHFIDDTNQNLIIVDKQRTDIEQQSQQITPEKQMVN